MARSRMAGGPRPRAREEPRFRRGERPRRRGGARRVRRPPQQRHGRRAGVDRGSPRAAAGRPRDCGVVLHPPPPGAPRPPQRARRRDDLGRIRLRRRLHGPDRARAARRSDRALARRALPHRRGDGHAQGRFHRPRRVRPWDVHVSRGRRPRAAPLDGRPPRRRVRRFPGRPRVGGTSHRAQGLAWRERLGMRHNLRTLLKCYSLFNILRVLKRTRGSGGSTARSVRRSPRAGGTSSTSPRPWGSAGGSRDARPAARATLTAGDSSPAPPGRPLRRTLRSPEDPPTAADLIATPTLLPGHHSALGRLGAGWLPRRRWMARRRAGMCGPAHCTVRVAPDQEGRLEVEATFGPEAMTRRSP